MNFRHSNDNEDIEEIINNSNEVGEYNGGYEEEDDDDDNGRGPRGFNLNIKKITTIVLVVAIVGFMVYTKFFNNTPRENTPSDTVSASVDASGNVSGEPSEMPSDIPSVDEDPFEFQTPSVTSSTPVELPSTSIVLPSIVIGVPDEPSEPVSKEINVEFTVEMNRNNGKPIFTVHTNLPDKTRLMVILSNKDGLKICEEIKPENGVATTKEFTNKGNAIKDGDYDVTVLMLNSQYDSVKKIIGENYENLTGDLIKDIDGKKIAEKKVSINFKAKGDNNDNNNNDNDNDNKNQTNKEEIDKAVNDANTTADVLGTITPATMRSILASYNHSDGAINEAIKKCKVNWGDMAKTVLKENKDDLMKETDPEVAMNELLKVEGFGDKEIKAAVESVLDKKDNQNDNGNFTPVN